MNNGKVLLAEDEEQVRTLITRLLEKRGYQVLAAENGREALELASEAAHDVVLLITDMVMPEMGGAALVHALRARRPDLPVLCMTGYTRDEVESGDDLSGAAFIEKPFMPAAFLDQVEQLASP